MGYYKNLLILAEEGNKEAILEVAEHYLTCGNIKQAIRWFNKGGKPELAEKLTEKLANQQGDNK